MKLSRAPFVEAVLRRPSCIFDFRFQNHLKENRNKNGWPKMMLSSVHTAQMSVFVIFFGPHLPLCLPICSLPGIATLSRNSERRRQRRRHKMYRICTNEATMQSVKRRERKLDKSAETACLSAANQRPCVHYRFIC